MLRAFRLPACLLCLAATLACREPSPPPAPPAAELETVDVPPAADAGLQAGDLITAVDGKQVTAEEPLINALFSHAPGDKVTLTIERNGASQSLTVTLGERPASA